MSLFDFGVCSISERKALRSHSSSEVSETSFEFVEPEQCTLSELKEATSENRKPALPTRKPRPGASCLSQIAVLPILTAVQDTHVSVALSS